MVKIRTLRPVLTKLKMITPNMYLSQVPTLKLHVNLSHNHHQCKVTPLQRLTATIQQLKIFPKKNLITLKAVNTIYAPILILITQKWTDINVCNTLFFPLFVCQFALHFCSLFFAHTSSTSFIFIFLGHIQNYQERQQSQIHSIKKQQQTN